jgi:hypothetical protein
MLLDKVSSTLDVDGYRALQVKLIAAWPVGGGDSMAFLARAVKLGDGITLRLGQGFSIAGVRFHKGRVGEKEEWDVRVEPLLANPDRLWVEVSLTDTTGFTTGSNAAEALNKVEGFLRNQVQNAVLAMAGNKGGAS